jgi:NarL family two-component system response regulator LiaR
LDVLRLVATGLTNSEIATALEISERTVGNHIGSILRKLHLANRTQATLYALRRGLIDLEGKVPGQTQPVA